MQHQDPFECDRAAEAQVCKIMTLISSGLDGSKAGSRDRNPTAPKPARIRKPNQPKSNSGFAQERAERRARLVEHLGREPGASTKLLAALYGYTVDSVRLIKKGLGIETPHPQDRKTRARYKALVADSPNITDQAAARLLGVQRGCIAEYRRDLAAGRTSRVDGRKSRRKPWTPHQT